MCRAKYTEEFRFLDLDLEDETTIVHNGGNHLGVQVGGRKSSRRTS